MSWRDIDLPAEMLEEARRNGPLAAVMLGQGEARRAFGEVFVSEMQTDAAVEGFKEKARALVRQAEADMQAEPRGARLVPISTPAPASIEIDQAGERRELIALASQALGRVSDAADVQLDFATHTDGSSRLVLRAYKR